MDAPSRKRGNEEGTVYNARTGPPELGWSFASNSTWALSRTSNRSPGYGTPIRQTMWALCSPRRMMDAPSPKRGNNDLLPNPVLIRKISALTPAQPSASIHPEMGRL
jgi:hypothetical protein